MGSGEGTGPVGFIKKTSHIAGLGEVTNAGPRIILCLEVAGRRLDRRTRREALSMMLLARSEGSQGRGREGAKHVRACDSAKPRGELPS
jgi:hypothetical protein